MKSWKVFAAGTFLACFAYLLAWPTDVRPAAWIAPANKGFVGPFASNGRLSKVRRQAEHLRGPEAVAAGPNGLVYTGTLSGEIVSIDPSGRTRVVANTGGRPLGMKAFGDGTLIVADAYKGLLRVGPSGQIETLATSHGGIDLAFADDLDLTPRNTVLFTDATSRFRLSNYELDALEHRPSGRLLEYDLATNKTKLIKPGLYFANGVAASGDGTYALVNETWAYRVRRVFLVGPRAGKTEVVIDNLPGFPDNITYDRERDVFWVALASPRDAAIDWLSPFPRLRQVVSRLPRAARPKPHHHALALAIKGDGTVFDFLDDPRPESYAPVTSVLAHGGELWLGSLTSNGVARVAYKGP